MDRLISWGIEMSGTCCLCQMDLESRDHLFFGCSYSRSIWGMILSLCGLSRVIGGWSDELQWAVQNLKVKKLISSLLLGKPSSSYVEGKKWNIVWTFHRNQYAGFGSH